MEKINHIIQHPKWKKYVVQLEQLEKERIYCKHNLDHFLSVARIAYIDNLEKGLHLSKELIYATALLHDIGRVEEYLNGISHELASGAIALEILNDCDFSEEEQQEIINAIISHRQSASQSNHLSDLIYRADKKSRNCFLCDACKSCNWNDEKKNKTIER